MPGWRRASPRSRSPISGAAGPRGFGRPGSGTSPTGRATGRCWQRASRLPRRRPARTGPRRPQAPGRDPCVLGIELAQDRVAPQPVRDQRRRSGPAEGVQDRAALRAPGEDARLDQRRRERGEVRFLERGRRHGPYAALLPARGPVVARPGLIPAAGDVDLAGACPAPHAGRGDLPPLHRNLVRRQLVAPRGLLADRLVVVMVPGALREKVDHLVRRRGPVLHARRHRAGLVPDDLVAQPPAVVLERDRGARRDHHSVLWFQAGPGASVPGDESDALAVQAAPGVGSAGASAPLVVVAVAVPEVEPQGAVLAQDAPYLAEHVDHSATNSAGVGSRPIWPSTP